jgi:hypothetical protein
LFMQAVNTHVQQTYHTLTAASATIQKDSFEVVGMSNRTGVVPLIPDACILFRCADILHHQKSFSPYGILSYNIYPMIIPLSVKTIYILTEPLNYGT